MTTVLDPELSGQEGCALSAVPHLALSAPDPAATRGTCRPWLVAGTEPGRRWPKFGVAKAGRGGHGGGGSMGARSESRGRSGAEAPRRVLGPRARSGFD